MQEIKVEKIKKVVFAGVILLLFFPVIQKKFNIIEVKPLAGAIQISETNYFSFSEWFSSEYQEKKESHLNESFGFRNSFVRINNQLAYSLFKQAKANGVVIGKENYLYEENYIKAYLGLDYIGDSLSEDRFAKLKFIQDTLHQLNKELVLIFAAGKGSFYPEFFPDLYGRKIGRTNFEKHIELAEKQKLNYIDFNSYFIKNKHKFKHLLYPKYGIHWSQYGMCLAADSIISYLEKKRKINMPSLYWDEMTFSEAYDTDYDIAAGMNLFFRLKTEQMAYPVVKFEQGENLKKPRTIMISDSFYWGMFNFGISAAFQKHQFWYYNQAIYPESYTSPLNVSDLDLKQSVANTDVILIMGTEATLPEFGWGVIDNLYRLFHSKK
jgi:hypothetical protein